jgi:hypothetical protein
MSPVDLFAFDHILRIAREMKLGIGTVLKAAQKAGIQGSENPLS